MASFRFALCCDVMRQRLPRRLLSGCWCCCGPRGAVMEMVGVGLRLFSSGQALSRVWLIVCVLSVYVCSALVKHLCLAYRVFACVCLLIRALVDLRLPPPRLQPLLCRCVWCVVCVVWCVVWCVWCVLCGVVCGVCGVVWCLWCVVCGVV